MSPSVALTFARRQGGAKKLRREGKIPAVVYGRKDESFSMMIDESSFSAIMRSLPKGKLPNTIFELQGEEGVTLKALVKDVHYHKVTYDILHLDFLRLYDDVPASVNIPIRMLGVDACKGVKAGGVLRQVKRHLRVSCLPKDLPAKLEIDVSAVPLNGSARLAAITIPQNVSCRSNPHEVIAVVGKR